jgi:hypothetical protein
MITIHFVWAWLSAINATLPYLILTLAAYAAVYAWRKYSPRSWLWFESRVPFAAEFDAGEELAHNIALSLPSVIMAGALAALTSGGALVPTILGAVAGAFAPLLHHVRKVLPFDPYRGAVADSTTLPKPPRPPVLPILLLVLSLTKLGCSAAAPRVPCDASDHQAQLELAAHAVECRTRVQACKGEPACREAVIAECDAWGDKRCAEGAK